MNYFTVVGITFKREGTKQTGLDTISKYTRHGVDLRLEREPDNPYDKNAIKVKQHFKNGGSAQLGYVPSELAKTFAPLMDDGQTIEVKFNQKFMSKSGECRGLQLKFKDI